MRLAPVILAALLPGPLAAQRATAVDDFAPSIADGRSRADLSGAWQYIVDPQEMGMRPGRARAVMRDDSGDGVAFIEYDWKAAPRLTVPGDWPSQIEALSLYEGLVWHRRAFDVAPAPGRRRILRFGAVNYRATVYLNGEKVGEHEGGFTPFAIDVTHRLRAGGNVLVVGVDNRHAATSVPARAVDWWSYGGITREVLLLDVPGTFVRHHAVWLGRDQRIHARVAFDGPSGAGAEATLSLPDLATTLRLVAGPDGVATASVAAPRRLERWSPDRPRLYRAELRYGGELLVERVAFRTVAVRGPHILLNERPVFLRGIALHEEAIGPVATRAIGEAAARALLGEAKALGANYVRLAHYPHNEHMARLADEMGLMVWAEVPVYWNMAFGDPGTTRLARRMLGELIERDAGRGSIILWSVGNETPETPERLAFMRQLIADVRRRDPERLVVAALHDDADTSSGPDGMVRVDDALGAYLDVLAMNRYEGWYGDRNPPRIDEVDWTVGFDKPLIFSEFGADALAGFRADPLTRWSEDYQALLYDRTLAMAERIPNLAGISPWILKDFRSPRRFHSGYQDYWNRKGLIDPTGRRKAAWDVLRRWYADRAGKVDRAGR